MGAVASTWKKVDGVLDTVDQLKTLIGPVKILACSMSFASVASGTLSVINVISGSSAEKQLMNLGGRIQKSVEDIAKGTDSLNSQHNQHRDWFPRHVHDFVSMKHDEARANRLPTCFIVFTAGTEWHAAFHNILKKEPLPGLCGVFSDIAVMGVYLHALREAYGSGVVLHVLVPSVHALMVPGELSICESLLPLRIEGELHQTGSPYVHVNMPKVKEGILVKICNIATDDVGNWRKSVWSISTATVAGGSAAVGGGIAGWIGGFVVVVGSVTIGLPVAAPVLVCATAATAAAATAGALAGKRTREKVENKWDMKYGDGPGTLTGIHLVESIINDDRP